MNSHNPIQLPVDDFSTPIILSTSPDQSIKTIIEKMKGESFRHIPVLVGRKPVGIISDRDLHNMGGLDKSDLFKARDIMVHEPYCVQRGTPIDEVAFEMSKRKIGSALVINSKGELDSIFTSVDGLNALIEVLRGDYED